MEFWKCWRLEISRRAMRPIRQVKTSAIRDYAGDGEIFRLIYGDKSAELLKGADESTIRLARQYDFVHSSERLSVLENHKICLFGTAE